MAIPFRKAVKEDLDLGYGPRDVPMPGGGTAQGTRLGLHTFWQNTFNLLDFGAVGDGVTDDTKAMNAAIAALPLQGGTIILPPAYTFAMNITITRSKVRIIGGGLGRVNQSTYSAGVKSADTTQPAITVANDTANIQGIELDNLEFVGGGTCSYGLKFQGGANYCHVKNCAITGFTKKGLWLVSGATYSIAYIYFNGCGVQNQNAAASEHCVYVAQGASATSTEAVFFSDCSITGVNYGYAVELSGTSNTVFTNTWIQVSASTHGVLCSQPYSTVPRLNGNGLFIDSDTGTDVLVAFNFAGATNAYIGTYVTGYVGIDGKVDLNGTQVLNLSSVHVPYLAQLIFPAVMGSAYFSDYSDPNTQTMRIFGASGTQRLHLEVQGASSYISLDSITTGQVILNCASLAAPYYSIANSAAGQHLWTANGVDSEFTPGTAGAIWFKTNTVKMGASALTLTLDQANGLWKFAGALVPSNNAGYQQFLLNGTTRQNVASYDASDNLFIGGNVSTGTKLNLDAKTFINIGIAGAASAYFAATTFSPAVDNTLNLGASSSFRWKEVYAVAGAINTSDEREKQDILPIDDAVLDAWSDVQYVQYRWKDAVATKGDAARVHHGVIAQRIVEAFAAHNLDAHRYGLLCYDKWDASDVEVGHDMVEEEAPVEVFEDVSANDPIDPTKTVRVSRWVMGTQQKRVPRMAHHPAGDRYGIRADQCLVLEAALMRRTVDNLQRQIAEIGAGRPAPAKKR